MNKLGLRILPALILLAGLQPGLGSACSIMNKEQALERSRKIVGEAKAETIKLRERADLVFVGRLAKLSVEEETVDKNALQHYQAAFEAPYEIKGHYPEGQALQFTLNKNRIWISTGCRSEFWQFPKESGIGDLYLVYALDGKILRTNRIPQDAQDLSAREEILFISGQQ